MLHSSLIGNGLTLLPDQIVLPFTRSPSLPDRVLRGILSGGLKTEFLYAKQRRRIQGKIEAQPEFQTHYGSFGQNYSDDPWAICPFCSSGQCENLTHLWYECPAWQDIRAQFPPSVSAPGSSHANCLLFAFLCPLDPEVQEALDAIPLDETPRPLPPGTLVRESTERRFYTDEPRPRLIVWTGGACWGQADDRLRRAGSGVFVASSSRRNLRYLLPGAHQTNNRAELFAVVKTLEILGPVFGRLQIRTDSAYVVGQFSSLSEAVPLDGGVENYALWLRVAQALSQYPPGLFLNRQS